MSIDLVENEVRRFLSTEEPEVFCVRGRWGVGKTYAWTRYLEAERGKGTIALKHYSYVSLFGINSLDDLKYSIFENIVPSAQTGAEPTLEGVMSDATSKIGHLSKKLFGAAQKSSFAQHYVGGLGSMCFLSVKDSIVCLDDIERRGANLSIRDVLGLVSLLKEQKRCKIVLILNDEALAEEKEQFSTYFEKVVDVHLTFAPSAREAASIALTPSNKLRKILEENCVALGIENIRVLKKIERAATRIESMLKHFDEQVLRQAVGSLALLGWSVYEPTRAPALEFLRTRATGLVGSPRKETVPANEAAWNALLEAYHFRGMDEFDLVLLEGLQNGFFNSTLVEKHGALLNAKITNSKSDSSFRESWRLFHESFMENDSQVLGAVYKSFLDTVRYRTHLDLNGTVWLLKALGGTDQAAECIKRYVAVHDQDPKYFDLDSYPFKDRIDDPDVIKALEDKRATVKEERDPATILLSIADANGWQDEDIRMLSKLPSDDYYMIFKRSEGTELIRKIDACLQFDRIVNATEAMKEISSRAREALKRLGSESPINGLRVKKYGLGTGA